MSERHHHNNWCSHSISMGAALAICISWSLYHSLLWAAIHGFFGWFYVIYYWFTR